MKITTAPDGTTTIEGSPEELGEFYGRFYARHACVPHFHVVSPHPILQPVPLPYIQPWPVTPTFPDPLYAPEIIPPWTITLGNGVTTLLSEIRFDD